MPTARKRKISKNEEKLQSNNNLKKTVCVITKQRKPKSKKLPKKTCSCKKGSQLKDNNALGIDRLLVPFRKFYKKKELVEPTKDSTMVNFNNPKTGLNPKEKNFLLCCCQQRSTRYIHLKALATEAENKKKIFLINGQSKAIRKALVERGWVEKIPPEKMDLSAIRNKKYTDDSELHCALERLLLSNLVEKSLPSFIWNLKHDFESEKMIQNRKVIHNKIKNAALWSTKQGLCASIRNNYWYFIKDVADVNSPRTYNSSHEGEKEEFDSDYKLTACTSLLKWILYMLAKDRPIFVETGNIGINVIVFALNRCKEYLFQKQNKDIDKPIPATTSSQWNAFLKKYYILIAKQDTFQIDKDNRLPLYLRYAKYMIKEIHKYRPQLSCEGCHNIWIIKPACCSRGRGIRMASKLGVLTDLLNRDKYVFQKYIEESMLIYETKFDVRQYYLVTSTFPLVIWMYRDCYLKFSSQKYNLNNYHEAIHLTNNAVQKKYKNAQNRHPELPAHNMWSLDLFKSYLAKIGREQEWDAVVYPGMKKCIVGIMLSCQESTSIWKNRFELYGCDFILDKNFVPWLIEINSGPDLNPTTEVTAQICPAVLTDVIKVVVDRAENPEASTGKFECIYRQNIRVPPCGRRTDDLIIRGYTLPNNYFYSGIIHLDDYSMSNVSNQHDVASILKKLRTSHYLDKMNTDRSSEDVKKNKSLQKVTILSSSVDERKRGGTVLTDQLDSLLDHISSNASPIQCINDKQSSPSVQPEDLSSPSSNNFRLTPEDVVLTGDKKSCHKDLFRCASDDLFPTKFAFSKLDDGPSGKGSGLVVSLEKINSVSLTKNLKNNKFENLHGFEDSENGVSQGKPIEDFNYLESTKKLFSFLSKKRKEYGSDISY